MSRSRAARAGLLAAFSASFALALVWSRSAPAQVDGGSALSPAVVALCREALAHAKKGEFEEARTLYAKAFEVAPSPTVLFNLALAELNAGVAVDALRHFREYVQAKTAEPSKLAIVRSELLPKAFAATGHIQIANEPFGSVLYVDLKRVTHAPGGIVDVAPGEHVVAARTPDTAWAAAVHVTAGTTAVTQFKLIWVIGSPKGGSSLEGKGAPLAQGDGGASQR